MLCLRVATAWRTSTTTHLFGTSWETSAHRSSGVGSMCMSPGTVSSVLHYLRLMRTTFFINFLAFGWDLKKEIVRISSSFIWLVQRYVAELAGCSNSSIIIDSFEMSCTASPSITGQNAHLTSKAINHTRVSGFAAFVIHVSACLPRPY